MDSTPDRDAGRPSAEPMNPCPVCGAETEMGFGLAGGGYGAYLWCDACEAVVSKSQCDD